MSLLYENTRDDISTTKDLLKHDRCWPKIGLDLGTCSHNGQKQGKVAVGPVWRTFASDRRKENPVTYITDKCGMEQVNPFNEEEVQEKQFLFLDSFGLTVLNVYFQAMDNGLGGLILKPRFQVNICNHSFDFACN